MTTLHDFTPLSLAGQPHPLADHRGKVALVVNTASKCGLTPQFAGLEKLWADHAGQGLVVLGFPCDQFAHQEFDEASQIAEFCQLNYGVSFPMFAKVDVNGETAHPLWRWLRSEAAALGQTGESGDEIEWNFTKFLVDREGRVVRRYAPGVEPAAIEDDVRALLAD